MLLVEETHPLPREAKERLERQFYDDIKQAADDIEPTVLSADTLANYYKRQVQIVTNRRDEAAPLAAHFELGNHGTQPKPKRACCREENKEDDHLYDREVQCVQKRHRKCDWD